VSTACSRASPAAWSATTSASACLTASAKGDVDDAVVPLEAPSASCASSTRKKPREQRDRNEKLGLSPQEMAYYDVLAAKGDAWVDDPRLKDIAADIVRSLTRPDDPALGVDWTERSNLEAKVRLRIKKILRANRKFLNLDGGDFDAAVDRVFDQARTLYERWPEVEDAWC
jgi:hypothetical protein